MIDELRTGAARNGAVRQYYKIFTPAQTRVVLCHFGLPEKLRREDAPTKRAM
jgi:hypothetical protein